MKVQSSLFRHVALFVALYLVNALIIITLRTSGLFPSTEPARVQPQAAGATIHKIEFKAPFPTSIDIACGDSIILFAAFSGDPRLFDPRAYSTVKTTDRRCGDVFDTVHTGTQNKQKL